MPRIVPSLGLNSLTIDPVLTHKFAPSNTTYCAGPFTGKDPRFPPSLARNFVTSPLVLLATQILDPSNAIPTGWYPTVNIPLLVPSRLRRVTVFPGFVTQMYVPSKTTPEHGQFAGKSPSIFPFRGSTLLKVVVPV